MFRVSSWIKSHAPKPWVSSDFSDLPSMDVLQEDPASRCWLLLVGGLGLILSRASEHERMTRFKATHELYRLLRSSMDRALDEGIDPALLNEVRHEIAEVADPLTRAAAARCFRSSLPPPRQTQPPATD